MLAFQKLQSDTLKTHYLTTYAGGKIVLHLFHREEDEKDFAEPAPKTTKIDQLQVKQEPITPSKSSATRGKTVAERSPNRGKIFFVIGRDKMS